MKVWYEDRFEPDRRAATNFWCKEMTVVDRDGQKERTRISQKSQDVKSMVMEKEGGSEEMK